MRIAITGGIGSGKSYVADYIKSKGYKVLYADDIAKDLMEKGQINYQNIIAFFGQDILDSNNEIDRKKLRKIVFTDEKMREKLNSLTHPNIMKNIIENTNDDEIYFVEIPLLFEEHLEEYFNQSWVVDCSIPVQISRVCARSNMTDDEVMVIINSQLDREEKIKKANVVINSEDPNLFDYIDKLLISLEKQDVNEKL